MRSSFLSLVLLSIVALAAALTGCAGKDASGKTPRPKNGIAEYRELAVESVKAVGRMLGALHKVTKRGDRVPPKAAKAFADAVDRLEIESFRVRERAQAIRARGDAYFEHWQENLARIPDARVRELAQKHHAQLEKSFGSIKSGSQQAREAFQKFLADLRTLRTALENDPEALTAASSKDLVREIEEKGRQLEFQLTNIKDELRHMTELVSPSKQGSKH